MEPDPGAEIGEFVVERRIGEGSFGAVWSGIHIVTGQRVALKVLMPASAANPEHVRRFRREAEFLLRVASPFVARIIAFLSDERFGMVLVMEFIDGELLSDILSATLLSVEEMTEIGIHILTGVRDLHVAGVLHRDLKPSNVLIRMAEDGSHRAVIFDLGLSRLLERFDEKRSVITTSHVLLGTLACMAPEQILNAKDATERSDLYAVGTILYRGVSGRFPFEREDARTLAREKVTAEAPALELARTDLVAEGMRALVTKAIRRQPARRFTSADEMLTALTELHRPLVAAASALVATDPAESTQRTRLPTYLSRSPEDAREKPPPTKWPLFIAVALVGAVVSGAIAWLTR